jgi:hypothetical protein
MGDQGPHVLTRFCIALVLLQPPGSAVPLGPRSLAGSEADPEAEPEAPKPVPPDPTVGRTISDEEATQAPPPMPDPGSKAVPTAKIEEELVRVAVGFSPEAPGTKAEKEIVAALEASAKASERPTTEVRRLRAGSDAPKRVCREGIDDLVVVVGYLPDEDAPVLLAHDCRLDVALGARSVQAASDPALVGVLWDEHRKLVAEGAEERRRVRMNPKLRNGLIIGGASLVIAGAITLLLVSAFSRETVVLKVSPR